MKKILYVVSEDHYFCSHRLVLAKAAVAKGYDVVVATKVHHHRKDIEKEGIRVIPLGHFHRSRTSPVDELSSLIEIYKIYKKERPDIVHHVALKLVLYGSLAAIWARVPRVINTLGGLGYLFISRTLKARTLRFFVTQVLSRVLGRSTSTLIVQNPDDLKTFIEGRIAPGDKVVLIRGSGVDLRSFKSMPFTGVSADGPVVAFVSRMLRDKGVEELIEAIQILKSGGVKAQFLFYGGTDPTNPTSLSEEELNLWTQEGWIRWEGETDDIATAYQQCHIAVLPSYREGLPKSLIEAAACGRPIVTTDVPGCREVVIQGENGLLVPPRNSAALAFALEKLIQDSDLRKKMGEEGHRRATTLFDEKVVIPQTLDLYES